MGRKEKVAGQRTASCDRNDETDPVLAGKQILHRVGKKICGGRGKMEAAFTVAGSDCFTGWQHKGFIK